MLLPVALSAITISLFSVAFYVLLVPRMHQEVSITPLSLGAEIRL